MFVAVVLAAAGGVVAAVPAAAGGSWLEVMDGDDVLVPGEIVTLTGTFGAGQQAAVAAGPWQASLRSDDERGSAVALGPVAISDGPDWGWRATVTFTVPTVPTGDYWVTVVNDQGEGVGDLIGGFVHVAPSLEAWRVSVLRQRLERQQEATRKQVATVRDRLVDVRAELEATTSARDQLADRADDLERAREGARNAGAQDAAWLPWLPPAAALAVMMIVGLIGIGRRRTAKLRVVPRQGPELLGSSTALRTPPQIAERPSATLTDNGRGGSSALR